MSIQAVAWALEQDLPARPKLVLVSICNHASHTDGYCWLNAETIAAESACTPRSVYKFVGGLVRNGYVRKAKRRGEDGKQRANDFWVMFGRPEAKWDWEAGLHDDVEDHPTAEDDGTISCEPSEQISPGENEVPTVPEPVEKHVRSPGPSEAAFTRYESAEPSKTKSEKESGLPSYVPRTYRAPPPTPSEPMGTIADPMAKQIFVFSGSRAMDEWSRHSRQTRGGREYPTTWATIDGKRREGWWFPSLFPPDRQKAADKTGSPKSATDPPTKETLMTEADFAEMEKL